MVAFAASTTVAAPLGAQTRKDRVEAQKLAGEALDLFEAGDYEAALERFEAAHALVPAPTLLLRVARSLDKLDRMQEAAERYREVIGWELDRFAPPQHRKAREDAVPELAALLEQLPQLVVTVDGPGAGGAAVTVDGEPLAAKELGDELPRDPGAVTLVAQVDGREATETVTLTRGEVTKVTLTLPAPAVETQGPAPDLAQSDGEGSEGWTIAGWSTVGLGGALLLAGLGTGVAVVVQESDLESRCPDRRCPPEAHGDAESFDTLRSATTGLLVAGGVTAAAGVALLLLAPGDEGAAEDALTWSVGPGFVGVAGRF